jgi:hypothetical protein
MRIAFAARSIFKDPIEQAVLAQRVALDAGRVVTVLLDAVSEGYPGQVTVELSSEWSTGFISDWQGRDPSRFPARLKAAATVLNGIGAYGRFVLTHRAGTLTLQRLPSE